MAIILFIILIIFIVKYSSATNEIKELKKQLKQYENKEETETNKKSEEFYVIEKTSIDTEKTNNVYTEQRVETKERTIRKEKNNLQTKNTLILIAGAILIVLAAIVFLMSTWNTIPSAVKTGTLILLVGVFFGASYLAKNKLHLYLTAQTFYYIAMAYIPIVMISISVFELFGTYLSIFGEGKYLYFAICTIVLSILYLFEVIKNNRKPLLICSVITQILAVIFVVLMFSVDSYLVIFGIIVYTLIAYIVSQNEKLEEMNLSELKNIIFVVQIIATVLAISFAMVHWMNASCRIVDILNVLLVTVTYYLMQKKNSNLKFVFDIGLLLTILTVINFEGTVVDVRIKTLIMAVSLCILNLYNYITTHKVVYKIITYISLNILLFSILLVFEVEEYTKYIPFITTLIVWMIERTNQHEFSRNYLIASSAISLLLLNVEVTLLPFICILILDVVYITYIKRNNMNEGFMVIPMLSIIPSLFSPTVDLLKPYYLNIILSMALIILTTSKSVTDKKMNSIYLFSSLVYILLSILAFKMNTYINLLLILLWAVVHAATYEKPDVFKVIAYITGLALYNNFLIDLEFTPLTIFASLGYLACLYLITRTVIQKHTKDYKIFEYIFTALIFIYALNTYTGITDAMIYIFFLVVFVIFGYIKKVGPLFLTSLIAVVINIFKLTKEFWQSIPWWVYMLVVGSILISFAIRNEINEKEEKINIGHITKKLKDKFDL